MPATVLKNSLINLPPLILLAGGKSERMGQPKGLLKYHNKAWLRHQLDVYRSAGGQRAVIVLGYSPETYLNALPELSLTQETRRGSLRITTVLNEQPKFGPFSSIQTGAFPLLRENYDCFFFLGIDRPAPDPETWQRLVLEFAKEIKMAYPRYNGKNGHPVLLSADFAKEIINIAPENARMDMIRDTLPEKQRSTIETMDAFTAMNINTPAEWNALCEKLETRLTLPKITALVGKKRSGKTTKIKELILKLSNKGIKTGGIIQPASDTSEMPEAYFVQDILSQERKILAKRLSKMQNGFAFAFEPEAVAWAKEKIIQARQTCDILIVDEIGRLEAEGNGHMPALLESVEDETAYQWLLCTRNDCFTPLKERFPAAEKIDFT